jgi:hypothetical protein
MTTMISEVYDAFKSVGITDDKARAAAEALDQNNAKSFDKLERKIDARFDATESRLGKFEEKFGDLKTSVKVLQWVVLGFLAPAQLGIFYLLLQIMSRIPPK